MTKTFITLVLAIPTFIYILIIISLYFFQENLLFPAEKLPRNYQFVNDYPFEEVFIPVREEGNGEDSREGNKKGDGAILHALHFRRPDPRGLVFFLHGNAGSLRTWATGLDFYERVNYDLFIIDYRGYGKSTGKISSQQQLVSDVKQAWQFASALYPDKPTVIYGRSLGSGLATILAKEVQPDLLALVSPFSSMADIAKAQYPLVPSWLLRYPLRTDQIIGDVKSKITFIHGNEDVFIPLSHSQKLQSLSKSTDTLITIEGATHSDIHQFADYRNALESVLP
ncbi:MAG: pimeloyl-ACP methyl ester carboxylesterase [Candidatus Endobugula sp.]|jgi:pimeloyl-ACP methyl ester carboxylesterase